MFLHVPAKSPPWQPARPQALVFDHGAGTRFAVDAEMLHKQRNACRIPGFHLPMQFKALDIVAHTLCFIGGVGTVTVAWWMFFVGLAAPC
ncbi:MAG: hypothetical protein R3B98_00360 [Hyphomonas sp.]